MKLKWVKQARLAMMMVGQAHKDIHVLCRSVAEYWSRQGKLLTLYAFSAHLCASVESKMVHTLVKYVNDYAVSFEDCIYHHVEGINDARTFIIKEPSDGAPPFRYKLNGSHKTSCPAEKDAEGNPKKAAIICAAHRV
eukprot:6011738-Pleurochrysis_carterae.AAC.3